MPSVVPLETLELPALKVRRDSRGLLASMVRLVPRVRKDFRALSVPLVPLASLVPKARKDSRELLVPLALPALKVRRDSKVPRVELVPPE